MERGINTRRVIGGAFPILIVAALLALFFGFRNYVPALHGPKLSVTARHLPYYAFCSFNRMLVAYVLALLFSICYGMMAARGRIWERVMIPAIDIAQSVPVVGFFPAAVYFFVALAHGSRLGVEMAAVFLISPARRGTSRSACSNPSAPSPTIRAKRWRPSGPTAGCAFANYRSRHACPSWCTTRSCRGSRDGTSSSPAKSSPPGPRLTACRAWAAS